MQVTSPSHALAFHSLSGEPINIKKKASVNYSVAALGCSEFKLHAAVAKATADGTSSGNPDAAARMTHGLVLTGG